MSIPIPIHKDNADEKARRVRLLRIWTDICAMALCEMPEGRSENLLKIKMEGGSLGFFFSVDVHGKWLPGISTPVHSTDPDAEEKLADIQRRLKPYVA